MSELDLYKMTDDGEHFQHVRWDWYRKDHLPAVRIARIRRGKYVRIPTEWRGKTTDDSTKRKRRREARKLTVQERRTTTVEQELEL